MNGGCCKKRVYTIDNLNVKISPFIILCFLQPTYTGRPHSGYPLQNSGYPAHSVPSEVPYYSNQHPSSMGLLPMVRFHFTAKRHFHESILVYITEENLRLY